jgi:hypothetical protein
VAASCLTAAAAHAPITEDHLHEALYIGVLFIALSAACTLAAAALLIRDARAVYVAVAMTCAAAIGAYIWSRAGCPRWPVRWRCCSASVPPRRRHRRSTWGARTGRKCRA